MYLSLKEAIDSERVEEFISQEVNQSIATWGTKEYESCKSEDEVRDKAAEVFNRLDWLNIFDGYGLGKDDFDNDESALKKFQMDFISSWNAEFTEKVLKLWEKEVEGV